MAILAACGTSAPTPTPTHATAAPGAVVSEGCADVTAAAAERVTDGTWTFRVTVSSADTGWEKYADAWEVRTLGGEVLGTRELLHPHVDEQPFVRSLSGVSIPSEVDRVVIAARDSVAGFCGTEFTLGLS